MAYDGRYGKVAKAMRKKRAVTKYGPGPSHGGRRSDAARPTQGEPPGPPSPKLPPQERPTHPVKADATKKASGFRSFKSIVRGNVMKLRAAKKLAPASK